MNQRKQGIKLLKNGNANFYVKKSLLMMTMKRENKFRFTPLDPRDSLYGGRTSPACLFKNVEEN